MNELNASSLLQLLRKHVDRIGTRECRWRASFRVGFDDEMRNTAHAVLGAEGVDLGGDLVLIFHGQCRFDGSVDFGVLRRRRRRRRISEQRLGKALQHIDVGDVGAILEVGLVHDLHELVGFLLGLALLHKLHERMRLLRWVHVAIMVPVNAILASHAIEAGVGITQRPCDARAVLFGEVLLDGFGLHGGVGVEEERQPFELHVDAGLGGGLLQVPQRHEAEGSHDVADDADVDGGGTHGWGGGKRVRWREGEGERWKERLVRPCLASSLLLLLFL
mmetsp:Transcript_11820/g.34108  ORF Transcript_11820/g.34108 Transcript_11820/m.34108 type:complete len:276 (-) Transcript_11820:68-895(-)